MGLIENIKNVVAQKMASKDDMVSKEEYQVLKQHFDTILEVLGENPETTISVERLTERLQDRGITDYKIASAASAIFMRVAAYRTRIIRAVDEIRHLYIVDVIMSQMTEDALSPEAGSMDLLHIHSDDPKINESLEELQNDFNLDQIISDICPDLIGYGSYILGVVVQSVHEKGEDGQTIRYNKYGVVDIRDDVDQEMIVPVNRHGQIQTYLVFSRERQTIESHKPWKYVSFSLGGSKQRINLQNEYEAMVWDWETDPVLKDIPRYLRVGKSIIYPIISKILELDLLEKLIPAAKINEMASGNLVAVGVPPSMSPEEALKACKKVEGMLNQKIAVDMDTKRISIENILSAAGRYKCIPNHGDGKGTITNQNAAKNDSVDQLSGSVKDTREVILSSIGVPYEIYYGAPSTENKGATLRRYARYLRKLKAIQTAIEEGIKQLVIIHLENKGIEFEISDITISFRNKLIDVDLIDQLEFLDTTVGLLGNVLTFVDRLVQNESIKGYVDMDEVVRFIDSKLEVLGMGAVLQVPEKGIEKPAVTLPHMTPTIPQAPSSSFNQARRIV